MGLRVRGGGRILPSALVSKLEVEGGQEVGPKPLVRVHHEGGACQGRDTCRNIYWGFQKIYTR